MPASYRASSPYNRRHLEAGRVFRGSPSAETDASHVPSIPPLASLSGNPHDADWADNAGILESHSTRSRCASLRNRCALYQQMARIAIEPTWAKLMDFETRLPRAVEQLVNR
jgi:hypothetical protein